MDTKIAGVDEAGRGPLAGPVIAAAVIFAPDQPIQGITDSKKLSEKKRLYWYEKIRAESLAWALGRAEVEEIDSLNILKATMLAMKRAVEGLAVTPDKVLVDGNRVPDIEVPAEAIIKGDQLFEVIGAASILAKVARDLEIKALDACYPQYGLAQHKGYPTKQHCDNIRKFGVSPVHRRSFEPVKSLLET